MIIKIMESMKKVAIVLVAGLLVTVLPACQQKKKTEKTAEDTMEMSRQKLNNNYVDTLVLRRTVFSRQINCNGKLRAVAKSELTMPSAGLLDKIYVHNGSVVAKGALLASVDKSDAERALRKAEQQKERSEVDLLDRLISAGYDDRSDQVPEAVMKRARIASGYQSAEEQLEEARLNLKKCSLYAPFAGRVANMDSKLHQRVEGAFCTLIDDAYFDVEFNILEAEMTLATVGQRVVVTPFVDAQKRFEGRVTEVNPLIDEKGQVKLRARIRNERNELVEGMNVRVVIESDVPEMFVVPKDAVVQRDGYYVVFCYRDEAAVWTYVDVLYANLGYYAITGNAYKQTKIQEGDVIITSGNLNLADGTPVIPKAPSTRAVRK